MTDDGIERFTPYALVAVALFEFMHIADELAGNWAPFEPFNEPTIAAFMVAGFLLLLLWALWWVVADRPWGYGLAVLFGLLFLLAEMWHWFDPAHMNTFRWAVVILAQLSAATVVVCGVAGLRKHKPWRKD